MANHYSGWTKIQAACPNTKMAVAAFWKVLKEANYANSGIAVLIEPDAQFLSGFGAMVHSRVVCAYNLRADHVINVTMTERQVMRHMLIYGTENA